jgi:ribosomal protein S18 acetylase RimI-like enzyme
VTDRIDRVGPEAWSRLRGVRLRALGDAPDAFWSTTEGESRLAVDVWRRRLARPDAATFLAVRDGVDVGLAIGAPHHVHPSDAGLYSVWVAPAVRGSGVADRLITAVVDWARAAGHPRIRLDVADANRRAVALYARLGFARTGATSRFPPPRDHIVEHERALELRVPAPGA